MSENMRDVVTELLNRLIDVSHDVAAEDCPYVAGPDQPILAGLRDGWFQGRNRALSVMQGAICGMLSAAEDSNAALSAGQDTLEAECQRLRERAEAAEQRGKFLQDRYTSLCLIIQSASETIGKQIDGYDLPGTRMCDSCGTRHCFDEATWESFDGDGCLWWRCPECKQARAALGVAQPEPR